MSGDSISSDLAVVIFSAAGGTVLLVMGLLAVGLCGLILVRLVLGPAPRGGRRLSVSQMLRAARASSYEPAPILNRPERQLFAQVEHIVGREMPGHRVMGQVALSEAVRPAGASRRARHAVEAVLGRSLDMAVIDRQGRVVRAIEYDGPGRAHCAERDAVKAEILAKAGIVLVAVPEAWDPKWLRREIVSG